jgi:hypothetical protein
MTSAKDKLSILDKDRNIPLELSSTYECMYGSVQLDFADRNPPTNSNLSIDNMIYNR